MTREFKTQKWTVEKLHELIPLLLDEAKNYEDIAAQFGVSRQRIEQISARLRKMGAKIPRRLSSAIETYQKAIDTFDWDKYKEK